PVVLVLLYDRRAHRSNRLGLLSISPHQSLSRLHTVIPEYMSPDCAPLGIAPSHPVRRCRFVVTVSAQRPLHPDRHTAPDPRLPGSRLVRPRTPAFMCRDRSAGGLPFTHRRANNSRPQPRPSLELDPRPRVASAERICDLPRTLSALE